VYAGGCAGFVPASDSDNHDILGTLVLPTGPQLSDVCIRLGWNYKLLI